jgi:hypothetical protein
LTYRTANLQSYILYIFSRNIVTEYFKHGIYSLFLSSSKCSLFHSSNLFGSCIIHILYTGCAKIKKIIIFLYKYPPPPPQNGAIRTEGNLSQYFKKIIWNSYLYRCVRMVLTFRRLMSTTVDVPHRQPPNVAFYVFIQQI